MKHKNNIRKTIAIVTSVAAALSLVAVGVYLFTNKDNNDNPVTAVTPSPSTTAESDPQIYRASLFVTGDALLHEGIWLDASDWGRSTVYNFEPMMGEIAGHAAKYDLAYYNQETILGGTELGLSGYPAFNGPKEFGRDMVNMGFDLVSTATNHSLDMGEAGITSSLEFWDTQNVIHAGTARSKEEADMIKTGEVNGITYAFLSWTYGCNGLQPPVGKEWMVNIYGDGVTYTDRRNEMLEQIRKADEMADVVIVAAHWGTEYAMEVNADQQQLSLAMSEAGADIIVGNHPHVIQPVSWINNGKTICYYAMGNLVSEQDALENNIGIAGVVDIVKTVDGDNVEVKVENARADLLYSYHDAGYANVHVYPFSSLTDAVLPNYQSIYNDYINNVVLSLDPSITIGSVFN